MTERRAEHRHVSTGDVAEVVAAGWERHRPFIEDMAAPLRAWILRALAPRPGDIVLELAAGAGDTGYEAAALIRPGGRLISTDVSPAMLDVARRRAAELGVDNVEHRVMDAQQMELDGDSVDGVICRFGFMLMPDPAAALAETRRVLRPGGRVALAVWGPPEHNPFFTVLTAALVGRGHMAPPDPTVPGPFSLASPARLGRLVEGAGFSSVRTEEVATQFVFANVDEYLGRLTDTAGPVAIANRSLSDNDRRAVAAQVEEGLASFATDGGYEIPGLALAAVAE